LKFCHFNLGKYNERKKFFPQAWKQLSLIIFVLSGVITPTIDGYTQLSLAFAAFSLYLIVITSLQNALILNLIIQ
jgi:Sec-independent protein secretion pathway component TatC